MKMKRKDNSRHCKAADESKVFVATPLRLMWWKFKKHRLALISGIVLLFIYTLGIFCEFLSPYDPNQYRSKDAFKPPQVVHFINEGKLTGPFVYGYKVTRDKETLRKIYMVDKSIVFPVKFFTKGDPYKFWGLWETDIHLFGTEKESIYIMGADRLGRDVFSRILYGARISMSIGLIGVFLSFVIGIVIGGLSGYFGGILDILVQRLIEFIKCIPTIPLWMALSAALPANWSPLKVYFGITIILSLIGWTGLARNVRSKFLSLREEDFVLAARLSGASELRIVMRHMVPSFMSYIIASMTLSIPGMILGETSLSFLGIGLRAPVVSWGVLLQEAQNVRTIAITPWLLYPGLFVIIAVLSFNFFGDGLRDAADPYVR